ncbi:MAG: cytochrome c oxidase subunit II [Schleiferiaceae bacterium]|jgi:cytochrome c oxidase subunit 2|nr:cytochrome c oxidase subunit II [Schleiferiaceae bacterium]
MTGLLIAVVAVLAILVVLQVMKVTGLSSDLQDGKDNEVSTKDNNTQGTLLLLFGIAFMVSFVWMIVAWGDVILPKPASEHGVQYDSLMWISMGLIILVFVLVNPVLFYFAFKYRGLKGTKATYYEHNNKLELIWTSVPAVVLAVLIIYGLTTWSNVMNPDNTDQEPMVVELYAQQFNWTARYSGEDNTLGYANVALIEGANFLGVDMNDDNAKDDFIVKELYLPKGKPVKFKFRSQDIIHSAYMPHFRAQMNCVPGMVTEFQFTPTITTDEMRADKYVMKQVTNVNDIRIEEGNDPWEFDYVLLCNKICGAAHYNMQMPIKVVEQAEYDKWVAEQQLLAQN